MPKKVSTLDGTVQSLAPVDQFSKHHLTALEAKTQRLAAQLYDLLRRAGRNITRIVGLPELVEGDSLIAYLEDWLQEMVPLEIYPNSVL
ncbi:hypothetical protein NDU88_005998 [Pleurodeles waltl]|uniref:Uncharacterized protein n=1 Tax=Pleurodeles waltl TaxID=8319 RepID=A0AAV7NRU1_PLEWA|nr:hypothetical protein NDU88_005998 [Pleurodeles waltl]